MVEKSETHSRRIDFNELRSFNEAFLALNNFSELRQTYDRKSLQDASGIDDDGAYEKFMIECREMLIENAFVYLKIMYNNKEK